MLVIGQRNRTVNGTVKGKVNTCTWTHLNEQNASWARAVVSHFDELTDVLLTKCITDV